MIHDDTLVAHIVQIFHDDFKVDCIFYTVGQEVSLSTQRKRKRARNMVSFGY